MIKPKKMMDEGVTNTLKALCFSNRAESLIFPNIDTNRNTENEILSRVIRWQLAKKRSGNHAVKSRSTVHHSTRKMFAQKGRGCARVGDSGSNIRRGGGIAMGPVVRSHAHKMPKKIRKIGRIIALLQKIRSENVFYTRENECCFDKTKHFLEWLNGCVIDKKNEKFLFVTMNSELDTLKNTTNNLHYISVLPLNGLNVYDIVRNNNVVFTQQCYENLILDLQKEV